MRRLAFRFYWKMRDLIVPELKNSQYLYYDALKKLLKSSTVWLDLGCGHQVFGDWMMAQQAEVVASVRQVVGFEFSLDSLRQHKSYRDKVLGGPGGLPFKSESFDVVTANMVVEHVDDPASMLTEVRRILKPNGTFIFHTTNARNIFAQMAAMTPEALKKRIVFTLDGRRESDVFKTYYRLNDSGCIRTAAESAGYEVSSLEQISTSAITAMLGPVVVLELLYLRLLRRSSLSHLRTNIIAVLKKAA
jgi:ubiquinone/menaquinone biosynthesis C-methylase UbiE